MKLQKRAGKVGFDWNDPHAVIAKIREEIAEIEEELVEPRRTIRIGWRTSSATSSSPSPISPGICRSTRRRRSGAPTPSSSAAFGTSRPSFAPRPRARPRHRSTRWKRSGWRRRQPERKRPALSALSGLARRPRHARAAPIPERRQALLRHPHFEPAAPGLWIVVPLQHLGVS